jgi:hypothetical protein
MVILSSDINPTGTSTAPVIVIRLHMLGNAAMHIAVTPKMNNRVPTRLGKLRADDIARIGSIMSNAEASFRDIPYLLRVFFKA